MILLSRKQLGDRWEFLIKRSGFCKENQIFESLEDCLHSDADFFVAELKHNFSNTTCFFRLCPDK